MPMPARSCALVPMTTGLCRALTLYSSASVGALMNSAEKSGNDWTTRFPAGS